MIKQQAWVIGVEQNAVIVETQRSSSCGHCADKQGCGTATLAKAMSSNQTTLRLNTDIKVNIGDQVTLSIDESALLKGSLFIYLFPLISLILAAIFGDYCARFFNIDNELLSILCGLCGFIASLLFARFNPRARQFQQAIQPTISAVVQ